MLWCIHGGNATVHYHAHERPTRRDRWAGHRLAMLHLLLAQPQMRVLESEVALCYITKSEISFLNATLFDTWIFGCQRKPTLTGLVNHLNRKSWKNSDFDLWKSIMPAEKQHCFYTLQEDKPRGASFIPPQEGDNSFISSSLLCSRVLFSTALFSMHSEVTDSYQYL